MTFASNRAIPAAKAIDDFQESLATAAVRAPRDVSGYIVIGSPFMLLAIGLAYGLLQALGWLP